MDVLCYLLESTLLFLVFFLAWVGGVEVELLSKSLAKLVFFRGSLERRK